MVVRRQPLLVLLLCLATLTVSVAGKKCRDRKTAKGCVKKRQKNFCQEESSCPKPKKGGKKCKKTRKACRLTCGLCTPGIDPLTNQPINENYVAPVNTALTSMMTACSCTPATTGSSGSQQTGDDPNSGTAPVYATVGGWDMTSGMTPPYFCVKTEYKGVDSEIAINICSAGTGALNAASCPSGMQACGRTGYPSPPPSFFKPPPPPPSPPSPPPPSPPPATPPPPLPPPSCPDLIDTKAKLVTQLTAWCSPFLSEGGAPLAELSNHPKWVSVNAVNATEMAFCAESCAAGEETHPHDSFLHCPDGQWVSSLHADLESNTARPYNQQCERACSSNAVATEICDLAQCKCRVALPPHCPDDRCKLNAEPVPGAKDPLTRCAPSSWNVKVVGDMSKLFVPEHPAGFVCPAWGSVLDVGSLSYISESAWCMREQTPPGRRLAPSSSLFSTDGTTELKVDHPGAKIDGELPDAEVVMIEDSGLLAEFADHAEEQRRSLAASPAPEEQRRSLAASPAPEPPPDFGGGCVGPPAVCSEWMTFGSVSDAWCEQNCNPGQGGSPGACDLAQCKCRFEPPPLCPEARCKCLVEPPPICEVAEWGKLTNGVSYDDMNSWDVSGVTNMQGLFAGAAEFNLPLDGWNVAKVTQMSGLFTGAAKFNQPLDSWNVAKVTKMSETFKGAAKFNQPLNSWNVAKVTAMNGMFSGAELFSQEIGSWNTAEATVMAAMFYGAANFKQNLNDWDVGEVTDTVDMFKDAAVFNAPLNAWNVAAVEKADRMFEGATLFNQGLGAWDVGRFASIGRFMDMFKGTTAMSDCNKKAIHNKFEAASTGASGINVDFDPATGVPPSDWEFPNLTC